MSHRPIAIGVMAATLLFTAAYAHSQTDPSSVRAQRKAEAKDAAAHYQSGEGNPVPEATTRTTKAERSSARQTRKSKGSEASREFKPGEGDPIPADTARIPSADRKAASAKRRTEVRAASKSGQIPSYGDDYGMKK